MIEFCVKLGEDGKEALEVLQEAHVPDVISRHTIFGFKERKRKEVNDA